MYLRVGDLNAFLYEKPLACVYYHSLQSDVHIGDSSRRTLLLRDNFPSNLHGPRLFSCEFPSFLGPLTCCLQQLILNKGTECW